MNPTKFLNLARRKQDRRVRRELRLFNHPDLKMVCQDCISDEKVRRDIQNKLLDAMLAFDNAVGIAAPQIGILTRAICIQSQRDKAPTVLFNPVIVDHSESSTTKFEQCLSYPGVSKEVSRFDKVIVKYQTYDNVEIELTLNDFEARILQHEMNHLDGLCPLGI